MPDAVNPSPAHESLVIETLARTRVTRALDAAARLCPDDGLYDVVHCARCETVLAARGSLAWAPLASVTRPVLLAPVERVLRERLGALPEGPGACRCAAPERAAQRVVASRWYHRVVARLSDVVLDVGPGDRSRVALVALVGPERVIADAARDRALAELIDAPLHLAVVWSELCRRCLDGAPQALEVEPGQVLVATRGDAVGSLSALRRAGTLSDDTVTAHAGQLTFWSEAWEAADPECAAAVRAGAVTALVALSRAELARRLGVALGARGVPLDAAAQGPWRARGGRFARELFPEALAARALAHAWSLSELAAVVADETAGDLGRLDAWLDALARERPSLRFEAVDGGLVPLRPDGTRGRAIDVTTAAATVAPGSARFERFVRYWCDPPASYAPAHRVCPCGAPASLSVRLVCADERPAGAVSVAEFRAGDGALAAAVVVVARCDEHTDLLDAAACASVATDVAALAAKLARDRHEERFTLAWEVLGDADGGVALAAWGAAAGTVFLEDGWLAALASRAGIELKAQAVGVARTFTPDTVFLHTPGFDPDALDALVGRAVARQGWPVGARLPFSLARDFDARVAPMGEVRSVEDVDG